MRLARILLAAVLGVAAATGALLAPEPPPASAQLCLPPLVSCPPPPPPPAPQCRDGVDNDGDGRTDYGSASSNDPGCVSRDDNSEVGQCQDGIDNDGDGKRDFGAAASNDPGCAGLWDDDETDPPPVQPACSDGVDNDGDGKTDAADPGCASPSDDDETSQCADGFDNDGDGKKDFGAAAGNDPGCSSKADNDETDPPPVQPACSDGVDNDGDGKTDAADPGCASPSDDDETSQCADGADNDGDGKVDFGQGGDPGCSSMADDDERDAPLPPPACSDGVDNDADAKTDAADPGCASPEDDDETSACANGFDDDGDGRTDFGASGDPGCASKSDDDETNPPAGTPQCSDGVDNDADGQTDAGADPGCASPQDDDETSQCADGFDNDGDGKKDFGAAAGNDPGCSSKADNDETDPPPATPQCSDGVDNDFDGKADYPADPGCAAAADGDETSRCANGVDDDGDGKVDFGASGDPGCSSLADNDEADVPLPPPQCSDGVDNDADGRTDAGADPGCSSAQDNDETSQCANGFDDDGDGRADFGAGAANDPGCSAKWDNDETDAPPLTPQCSDGVDNDADGRTDAGADPGCASSQDDDETSQCADGFDNDADGKVDFGAANDPGCAGLWDDDETDQQPPPPACSDGVDNDVDGKADYPADPGCTNAADDDETSRCANGVDDDGDGKVDFGASGDPGCSSQADDDETDTPLPKPACSDGVDNDADGKVDGADPGCTSPTDDDEADPLSTAPADPQPGGGADPPPERGRDPAPVAGSPPEPDRHGDPAPPADQVAADASASRIVSVARRIAPPWAELQLPSGLFRNPLTGVESPGGYGPVMIGQGLMREGLRRGDGAMVASGVRAVTATVSRSSGIEENPLQLLAVASAYNWARRALATDSAFAADRARWERYLATWKSPGVGPGAQRCFRSPRCFHSYDLIDAVATLELFATGVRPAAPDARLASPRARARAISVLGRGAYRAVGRDARTLGDRGRLHRLGILSDSPANPLAYHALSIATLARGISLLGDDAPAEARVALKRAVDASSSFAGPDGDVAYIGRAHGAVWALGATVYAAQVCARTFPTLATSTARRCDTLGGRTLERIVREYDFGRAGLNAIPRFRTSDLDARGLDPYANLVSSSGLTAMFLEWAGEELRSRTVPVEPGAPLPLDVGGAFQDPAHTRFAVMQRGRTWFAVHMEPTSLRDPRYDFGLMALKVRGRGGWSDVLPQRPLPLPGAGNASAGPVLVRGRSAAYPAGTRMSLDRATGTVTVHGGWRTRGGRWLRRGVAFRFRALRGGGVTLTWPAEKGDRFAVTDYVPAERPHRIARAAIRSTAFSSMLSPPARSLSQRPGFSSAYEASLIRVTRSLPARRTGTLSWTIARR